tara:strand:+ start:1391 stop:1573 length:183 start_codon:yes stop_codon:yes gene_type:complete
MALENKKQKECSVYKLMALSFIVIGFLLSPPWNQVVWLSGGLLAGTCIFRYLLSKEEDGR